jgi:hypothetical protein
MSLRILSALLAVLVLTATASADSPRPGVSPKLSIGAQAGYNGGAGFLVDARIADFATGFPLSARAGLGRSSMEPGSAADARRIFINNATNGTPEESGRQWDFRFDLMYPIKLLGLKRAFLYGGPRYSKFTGNFKYVGGNEDFDVTAKQWGFGTGLESHFPMSPKIDLVLTGGVDYYSSSTLKGHDTSYSPDGDDVNPREEYTFDDADKAISQPEVEFRLMMGIALNL